MLLGGWVGPVTRQGLGIDWFWMWGQGSLSFLGNLKLAVILDYFFGLWKLTGENNILKFGTRESSWFICSLFPLSSSPVKWRFGVTSLLFLLQLQHSHTNTPGRLFAPGRGPDSSSYPLQFPGKRRSSDSCSFFKDHSGMNHPDSCAKAARLFFYVDSPFNICLE